MTHAKKDARIRLPRWAHKLAPTLCEDLERKTLTESCNPCRIGSDCRRCKRDEKELRALLAVARAAQKVASPRGHAFCTNPDCPCMETTELSRALSRLARAAGEER